MFLPKDFVLVSQAGGKYIYSVHFKGPYELHKNKYEHKVKKKHEANKLELNHISVKLQNLPKQVGGSAAKDWFEYDSVESGVGRS